MMLSLVDKMVIKIMKKTECEYIMKSQSMEKKSLINEDIMNWSIIFIGST